MSHEKAVPLHTSTTYGRLAGFFDSKGDVPLSATEVAVCLEWLREVTQPTTTLMTPVPRRTDRTDRMERMERTERKVLPKVPKLVDLTPVKRQIRELIAERPLVESHMEDISMVNEAPVKAESIARTNSSISLMEKTPVKVKPIVMTRTAKSILDVLDRPREQEVEQFTVPEREPIQQSTSFKLPIAATIAPLPTVPIIPFRPPAAFVPEESSKPPINAQIQVTEIETSSSSSSSSGESLPTYTFDLGANMASTDRPVINLPESDLPKFAFN
jgi:hypothetical protein